MRALSRALLSFRSFSSHREYDMSILVSGQFETNPNPSIPIPRLGSLIGDWRRRRADFFYLRRSRRLAAVMSSSSNLGADGQSFADSHPFDQTAEGTIPDARLLDGIVAGIAGLAEGFADSKASGCDARYERFLPLGPRLCLGPHCPRGSASSSLPATNALRQHCAQCSPDLASIDGNRREPSGGSVSEAEPQEQCVPRRSLGTRKI